MSKKYTVRVSETLSRDVEVLANNKDEAINQVIGQYKDENIVLTSDDFVGEATFKIVK